MEKFEFNPAEGFENGTVFPTSPGSEQETRKQLMIPPNQLKDFINQFVQLLNSEEGAKEIGTAKGILSDVLLGFIEKNQGKENANKTLVVGDDGNVTLAIGSGASGFFDVSVAGETININYSTSTRDSSDTTDETGEIRYIAINGVKYELYPTTHGHAMADVVDSSVVLAKKQNKVLVGESEPGDDIGVDGDIYIMIES